MNFTNDEGSLMTFEYEKWLIAASRICKIIEDVYVKSDLN
jgi:hypothetical protein